jgi:hypothetical protein
MADRRQSFWETRSGQVLILALLTGGSAFLAFAWTGRKSFWLDEAMTVSFASLSPGNMVKALRYDTASPFYYLLVRYWMEVFGSGEAAVRGLSGAFYVGSVAAIYGFTRGLHRSIAAGLAAALLFMFSWEAILQAGNARNYSLVAFLGILSVSLYLRIFFGSGGRGDSILYVCVNACGFYCNYVFAALLLAQILGVLFLDARRNLKKCILLMFAGGLPFLLYLPDTLGQVGNRGIAWMERPGLMDVAFTFAHFYSRGEIVIPFFVYGFVPATLFFSLDGWRPSRRKWKSLREYFSVTDRRAVLSLLPSVLAVLILVSQYKPVYIVGRQSILVLIPTVLLIGPFLAHFNRRSTLVLFFIFVGLGTLEEVLRYRHRPERFSDRLTAAYLAEHVPSDDVLVFVGLTAPALEYYLERLGPEREWVTVKFPEEMSQHPGWIDEDLLLGRRESLDAEARNLSEKSAQSMRGTDRSLWIIYDDKHEGVSAILRKEIEERLTLDEKVHQGSFFSDGIYRYKSKETADGDG